MHLPPDQLRGALEEAGLGAHADALVALVRPSIRLHGGDLVPADDLPIGATKLGGRPDLPPGVVWPSWNGRPLAFVAQIDLAQVAPLDVERVLPPDGVLSFFYDAEEQPWGGDPASRGAWHVAHTPAAQPLTRAVSPAPIDDAGAFQCRSLRPALELTPPDWESYGVSRLGLDPTEASAYAAVVRSDDRWEEAGELHRLLGNPELEQGDMQVECEAIRRVGRVDAAWGNPPDPDLVRTAAGWRLLLQVHSDDVAGMMWGDMGFLYYWIRDEDVAARRFDRTWLMLQCG